MLDLIEQLANDYKAMGPSDSRSAGPAYVLRVLGQSFAEHPAYQQEWRPWPFKETVPGRQDSTPLIVVFNDGTGPDTAPAPAADE